MKKSSQKGFALFIAVVVSGLMLIVVLSISNIALKETILSGAGRESELAFYAADSGVECALFWDYRNPGPGREHSAFLSTLQEIECGSGSVDYLDPTGGVGIPSDELGPGGSYEGFNPGDPDPANRPVSDVNPVISQFKVSFSNGTCAFVGVEKAYEGDILKSKIYSRGQTDCANENNPRRYERAIRVID